MKAALGSQRRFDSARLHQRCAMIPPANCPRTSPSRCSPNDHAYMGTGGWVCHACKRQIRPQAVDQPFAVSEAERERLATLRHLHSNDGFGDAFREEPIIACRTKTNKKS